MTRRICKIFDINPLRLISSGSMLIIVPADRLEAMKEAMAAVEVDAKVIGRVREASEGIRMVSHAQTSVIIDPPYADEIYKVVGK